MSHPKRKTDVRRFSCACDVGSYSPPHRECAKCRDLAARRHRVIAPAWANFKTSDEYQREKRAKEKAS